MEAVFSLPDLEPMLGPLDRVARDAVILSLKRCQPLVLPPLPVDPSAIAVPAGLTPDLVKLILAGQRKAGCWDPWVPHQALFEHRHAEPSPPFHAEIVESFHSADPGWVYLCFRNSGKSTLSEEGFILRALLRLFGNALVLGFNQQRAVERLEAIKHEMETNERLGAIFGDMRGQVWQGQKVTLSNGVCLQAVGSGQSLRGIKHYDFRPDCLLLDDVEGDIGASTPLEREDTKKWFFGTVLPSLASRSIIRMAATPLDAECLPITLGKSPTWRTMVVPVKVIRSDPNDFFNTWCAEQGITATEDEDIAASACCRRSQRDGKAGDQNPRAHFGDTPQCQTLAKSRHRSAASSSSISGTRVSPCVACFMGRGTLPFAASRSRHFAGSEGILSRARLRGVAARTDDAHGEFG